MAGPNRSFEDPGQALYFDVRSKTGWIHCVSIRIEDDTRPRISADLQIQFPRPGVSLEVFAGSELGWVHENADNDKIAFGPGSFDQADVTCVKGTHCRNETDRVARSARCGDSGPDFGQSFGHEGATGFATGLACVIHLNE